MLANFNNSGDELNFSFEIIRKRCRPKPLKFARMQKQLLK